MLDSPIPCTSGVSDKLPLFLLSCPALNHILLVPKLFLFCLQTIGPLHLFPGRGIPSLFVTFVYLSDLSSLITRCFPQTWSKLSTADSQTTKHGVPSPPSSELQLYSSVILSFMPASPRSLLLSLFSQGSRLTFALPTFSFSRPSFHWPVTSSVSQIPVIQFSQFPSFFVFHPIADSL